MAEIQEILNFKILNNNKDVYLKAVYFPLTTSPNCEEEEFTHFLKEIQQFQSVGSVSLCGDLNARTGREPDFINTEGNNHISETPLCATPT